MTNLFKNLITTYGIYFNKKYTRVGPLFQSRFRASLITNDAYLDHISRYIHLNPHDYKTWRYSSLPYYLNKQEASWLKPQRILRISGDTPDSYMQFLADYEEQKEIWKEIRHKMADS